MYIMSIMGNLSKVSTKRYYLSWLVHVLIHNVMISCDICTQGILWNNSCYIRGVDSKTWLLAQAACTTQYGADLAVIESQEENDFIKDALELIQEDTWLGCRYNLIDKRWMCIKSLQSYEMSFDKWGENEPNTNPDHDCLQIRNDGSWIARTCQNSNRYICKHTIASGQCQAPSPLGLKDGTITDSQITSSNHSFGRDYSALNGRLDGDRAWFCLDCGASDWIEVDLVTCTLVTGVIMQGREDGDWDEYVSKYNVKYRIDTADPFVYITEADGVTPVVFPGPTDGPTKVTSTFKEPIATRFIRIRPVEWLVKNNHKYISLRMELLGCKGCFTVFASTYERNYEMSSTTSTDLMTSWDKLTSVFPEQYDPLETDLYKCKTFGWSPGDNVRDSIGVDEVIHGVRVPTGHWQAATSKGNVLKCSAKGLQKKVNLKSANELQNNQYIASDVISVTLFDSDRKEIKYQDNENPVEIELQRKDSGVLVCVSWSDEGFWSEKGCSVVGGSNKTHLICKCTHLTTFAGLFRFTENSPTDKVRYSKAVKIITMIFQIISILALTVGIILLLYLWKKSSIHKDMTLININLMLAMLIVFILLLVSEWAEVSTAGCLVVTILLHFAIVAMFSWMCVAAIDFYRMIVSLGAKKNLKSLYLAMGWGVPLFITVVTASVGGMKLNNEKSECLLAGGYKWAFLVPVILTILANAIILGLVMYKTMKATASREKDKVKLVKSGVKCLLLLLPLFGVIWLFGFIANFHIVLTYLFEIVSSLQGVYVLVIISWVNSEVRELLKREWKKHHGRIENVVEDAEMIQPSTSGL